MKAPAASKVAAAPAARGLSAAQALACVLGLLLLLSGVVVVATDRPLLERPSRAGAERRAALAIRDKVVPFQQWGTRSFTLPNLQAGYDAVEYITVNGPIDGHREAFVAGLERLARSHEAVDLFLLAHSNHFVEWTRAADPELRRRLRLVYNTGCFDLAQRQAWIDLGAKSYVGHVGMSESPVFYVFFLRRWLRGESLAKVVATSNELTGGVLAGWYSVLQINRMATGESTFAELTGDGSIAIDGRMP